MRSTILFTYIYRYRCCVPLFDLYVTTAPLLFTFTVRPHSLLRFYYVVGGDCCCGVVTYVLRCYDTPLRSPIYLVVRLISLFFVIVTLCSVRTTISHRYPGGVDLPTTAVVLPHTDLLLPTRPRAHMHLCSLHTRTILQLMRTVRAVCGLYATVTGSRLLFNLRSRYLRTFHHTSPPIPRTSCDLDLVSLYHYRIAPACWTHRGLHTYLCYTYPAAHFAHLYTCNIRTPPVSTHLTACAHTAHCRSYLCAPILPTGLLVLSHALGSTSLYRRPGQVPSLPHALLRCPTVDVTPARTGFHRIPHGCSALPLFTCVTFSFPVHLHHLFCSCTAYPWLISFHTLFFLVRSPRSTFYVVLRDLTPFYYTHIRTTHTTLPLPTRCITVVHALLSPLIYRFPVDSGYVGVTFGFHRYDLRCYFTPHLRFDPLRVRYVRYRFHCYVVRSSAFLV